MWTYRVVPASLDTGRSFAFFLAAAPADGASEPLGLDDDGDARWRRVAAAYGPDGARALARILRAIAAASTPRVSHDDDDSYDDDDDDNDNDDSRGDRPGESRRTRRPRPPSPLLPAPGRVACVGTGERAACAAAAELLGRYASHAEAKGTDAATSLSDTDRAVLLGESPFSPNHVLSLIHI